VLAGCLPESAGRSLTNRGVALYVQITLRMVMAKRTLRVQGAPQIRQLGQRRRRGEIFHE
jgi:hypothetical protein